MVSFISQGQDEIFDKGYVPKAAKNDGGGSDDENIYVHNRDGLLDIPPALMPARNTGRNLTMAVLSPEAKLQAKLVLNQQRIDKQMAAQVKL